MIHPPSQAARKTLFRFGVALALLLLGWILFAPQGIVRYFQVEAAVEGAAKENAQLDGANQSLTEQLQRLEADPGYLEEVARKQYGLVKKNEVIYQFEEKPKSKNPPATAEK